MADTHINAFHGAVELAQAEVNQAEAKLDAAETALKNHPDYEAPKKSKAKAEKPEAPKEAKAKK